MELVYLWVEDYKNIHKQGFNFSPRFECEYDGETLNICDKKKKECKDNNYIENFFGDNINVTAIVGKNGSGKSSVLEVLIFLYLNGLIQNTNDKTFFLYIKDGEFHIQCENFNMLEYNFSDFIIIKNKTDMNTPDYFSSRGDMPLLYFPNNLINDIMEKQPLNKFKTDMYKLRGIDLESKKNNFSDKFLSLLGYKNNFFSFLDENFVFNNFRYEIHLSKLAEYFVGDDKCEKLLSFYYSKELSKEELFYRFISAFLILETVSYIFKSDNFKFSNNRREPREKYYQSEICNKIQNFNDKKYNYDFYENIKDICSQALKKINENEKIKFILLEKKDIEELLYDYKILQPIIEEKNEYELGNEEEPKKISETIFISDIFSVQNTFIKLSPFLKELSNNEILKVNFFNNENLDYNFLSLSSGEQSYIKLLTDTADTIYKTDNYVFLYDEMEITLHPNWQKRLIHNIVTIFQLLEDKRKLHIILTTHSPFLLSDIPKQNIIFLDTDDNGDCKVVDGLKEKKETFGANIHTLLSDSFFMEDGLMGEFSKTKINKIIKDLKDENYCPMDKEKKQVYLIIENIGEPFLKQKLSKMYFDKFNTEKEDKIKELKAELKRLENG
jgi:predicted ATPase